MLSPYLRFGLVSPRQVLARVIDQSTPGTIWDSDCLLYTSDAADERSSVDLGGRRIIKKKKTSATACLT